MQQPRIVVPALCLAVAACTVDGDVTSTQRQVEGAPGWNILGPDYLEPNLLDGLSLEWDYFMVHDSAGAFTGILGYVLADPRGLLGDGARFGPLEIDLMPSGGNLAISGELASGERVAEFVDFGLAATTASATTREFYAARGDHAASIAPAGDALALDGRTDRFEWSLLVEHDWAARGDFAPAFGDDMGVLPGEHWTVHMLWPRTRVTGEIVDRATGEVHAIDGHGYRENSWGRWAFAVDGWDFAILSDAASGVQWAWQSYHLSDTMDFLDVSFYDGGTLVKTQFRADRGELGWRHDQWSFRRQARQCAPRDTILVGQNESYRVEARIDIGDRQTALLSDATPITDAYVIMEHFPTITGSIVRRSDGAVVETFAGQAGGEISFLRSPFRWAPDWACWLWGQQFSRPLP